MAMIIERAIELAKSGTCRSLRDIERRLHREGYERVGEHLHGASVRKQLNAHLRQAVDNGWPSDG